MAIALASRASAPPAGTRLRPDLAAHDAFVFIGNNNGLVDSAANPVGLLRANPNNPGMITPRGTLVYADHAGSDDDGLIAAKANRSPTSVPGTFILYVTHLAYASDQANCRYRGDGERQGYYYTTTHSDGTIRAGYYGDNGFNRFIVSDTGLVAYGVPVGIVISLDPVRDLACVSYRGRVLPGSWSGLPSYIGGGGTVATLQQPILGGGNGTWTQYYSLYGYVHLWAQIPGVYLYQDECDEISRNPWSIFAPQPRSAWSLIDPGGGGPPGPIDLEIQDAESASEADGVVITRARGLTIADAESASEAESCNVTVVTDAIDLVVQDAESASEADALTIARDITLSPDDAESASEADGLTIARSRNLTIADAESGSEAEQCAVYVSTGITLEIQDAESASEADHAGLITRARGLTIDDAESGSEADQIIIGRNLSLAVADAESASEADHTQMSIPGTQIGGNSNNVLIVPPETQILVIK